jgi:tetratricopeptide (TPR) repeat protein
MKLRAHFVELAQVKRAISESNQLSKQGDNEQALAVLDRAITEMMHENRRSWVCTLLRHASVIAESSGKLQLARVYRERCVALDPNSPLALFDLAATLHRLGEPQAARQYATRAYGLSKEHTDDVTQAIIESLLQMWPDLG